MFKKFLTGTAHFCMAPEGDAAAGGGSSGGAAAGGASATGGSTGATQQTVTTTATGEGGAAAGATTTTDASLTWYPGATQEEVAFAQSKGWTGDKAPPVDQVVKSYYNLQKVFGADKAGNAVILPGENADTKTVGAFYDRLGRPAAPDKYTAPAFQAMDPEMDKGLRAAAYEAGLTDKQVAALSKWNNDANASYERSLQDAGAREVATQTEALKKEWGAAYPERVAAAGTAAKALGWSDDQINGMQAILGFDGIMKLAFNLSEKGGIGKEGAFVGAEGGRQSNGGSVMTPQQAKLELNRLTTDAEFMKAWSSKDHPKHAEAIARKSQLSAWSVSQPAK